MPITCFVLKRKDAGNETVTVNDAGVALNNSFLSPPPEKIMNTFLIWHGSVSGRGGCDGGVGEVGGAEGEGEV